jgi:hypothetical protein
MKLAPVIKWIPVKLLLAALVLGGCSDDTKEAIITVQEDGKPARTLRIVVEDGDDVIVEDPYIEEIQAISAAYMEVRTRYINDRESMTLEERKAFGELQRTSGERIRELQALRKRYIIAQMKKYHGVDCIAEGGEGESKTPGQATVDYLKSFQKQKEPEATGESTAIEE